MGRMRSDAGKVGWREGNRADVPTCHGLTLHVSYRGEGDRGKVSAHLEAAADSSMAAAHFSQTGCSKHNGRRWPGSTGSCLEMQPGSDLGSHLGLRQGSHAAARFGCTGEDNSMLMLRDVLMAAMAMAAVFAMPARKLAGVGRRLPWRAGGSERN
jgi:hypothetical protein